MSKRPNLLKPYMLRTEDLSTEVQLFFHQAATTQIEPIILFYINLHLINDKCCSVYEWLVELPLKVMEHCDKTIGESSQP